MESKYYIPKIEEFCVGFEYQILNEENGKWGNYVHKYDDRILEELQNEHIRVKYLDQGDIEKEGFLYYKEFPVNYFGETCYAFYNEDLNLMLGFYPKSSRMSLATKDPAKNSIFTETNTDPNRITQIKIKNKTEFKKLLKQL